MNEIGWEDLKAQFFADRPRDVDGVANRSSAYYRNKLFMMILSRFEFLGIPENWELDYFTEHLFGAGYIAIVDTSVGVVPLKCGFSGINIYEEPTDIIIANPVLGNIERKIGENGALVRIQYNYTGVYELINRYATLLAMCDSSIAVNLMNTKLAYVFGAANKAQAQTLKKLFDDINQGKPAVFTSSDNAALMKELMFSMPAKQNYIAGDVADLKRTIMNEFLTEIGLNNANTDKKERLNTDEVNANNEELLSNVSHWLDNINEGFSVANRLFDLQLDVKLRNFDREGG